MRIARPKPIAERKRKVHSADREANYSLHIYKVSKERPLSSPSLQPKVPRNYFTNQEESGSFYLLERERKNTGGMFAAENGLKGDPRLEAISNAIRVVPNFPKPGFLPFFLIYISFFFFEFFIFVCGFP